ncbi:alpha/beta fold hydrolase [Paenalcaligenes hermetiae]
MTPIYLLNGWGMNQHVLTPLQQALELPEQQLLCMRDYIAKDLAHSLQHLRARIPPQSIVIGWSLGVMLALQLALSHPLRAVITLGNECARILRPGGYFLFSSVLEGSLYELKNSWAQVDDAQHVNHFRTASAYTQLCQASPLVIQHLHAQEYVYFYDHLRQLRHELKQLGANHLHAGRRPHLAAKDRLQRLQAAYDTYRRPQGLPATWHIIHLLLRKPS